MSDVRELEASEKAGLADTLGESPESIISVHVLRQDLCRAWVHGSPSDFRAAVVQVGFMPEEPIAFGDDVEAVWELLEHVPGWDCVEWTPEGARALGPVVEDATGKPVRYHTGIYFRLDRPAMRFENADVRLLGVDDIEAWRQAPDDLRQAGFADEEEMVEKGYAAGAFDGDRLVSIVQTSAVGERLADVGTFTLEDYRRRGYSTAAASRVCAKLQERGIKPVWSTGEGNDASQGVARRVGFERVGTTEYVIRGQR